MPAILATTYRFIRRAQQREILLHARQEIGRKANAFIPDWILLHLATVALSRVAPIPAVAPGP